MADSIPDTARGCALTLALCLAVSTAGAAETLKLPRPSKDQPIDLVAASSDVDYKNNTLVFRKVRITQGAMRVEADQASATGLNFENSKWILTGNVRITVPDGKLNSADATIDFHDNEIAHAIVHGTPAEFEQQLKESGQIARGHADTIEYDVQAGTVHLTGNAWLTDGENVIRGDTLIYDIAGQRVAANPGGTEPGGVHITINPRSQGKDGAQSKDKTPPKDKPQ
jgi:lipopolysaccharide transport protein LptA